MAYDPSDYLQLSGLQHFAFCRRQWALIHVEGLWAENLRTTEGALLHERAHDRSQRERRGDLLTIRGAAVSSPTLGISGQCDVLEYRRDPNGVTLAGLDGLWVPYPVEYKRGSSKEGPADRLQLCAQAMCLEEMLVCDIPEGSLFYGETRRRERVAFTPEMRKTVEDMLGEMRQYLERGYTPSVKRTKACNACSLKELCLPVLGRLPTVRAYVRERIEEGEP